MTPTKAGIIGLGAMGSGMARNLHAAGALAAAWNRNPKRAAPLAAEGLPLVDRPEEVARRAELILLSVGDGADVAEVVARLRPALRPGQIIADTSTIDADDARALASELATDGVAFLDAPVSGGSEGAANGSLAMMVGGDGEVLTRAEPLLRHVAAKITHMGPSGSGQATKAVNQIMAAGINQAVTEALAFAVAEGLDCERVIDIVGGGAAGNWFLDHRGRGMVDGRFDPGFRIRLHDKDLAICERMAERHGVHLHLTGMTRVHYQRLIEQGHGDEDISALFRFKRGLYRDER